MKTNQFLKPIALYSVFIGISVILFWNWFLMTQVPNKGFTELTFHIISEVLMALLSITAGYCFMRFEYLKPMIAAHAMLVYSTLNAAGYYIEKNEFLILILFVFLFIVSFSILIYLLFKTKKSSLKSV